jgi:hypothetical protein
MGHRALLGFILLFGSAAMVLAQDNVDNPEFLAWASSKKGTSVVYRTIVKDAKNSTEVLSRVTLIEVGRDKLVLETSGLVKSKAEDFKTAAQNRDVPRQVPLPKELTRDDYLLGKPPGTKAEGTEVLKIGGKEIKTRWYEYAADVAGTRTEAKLWLSDSVPGRMVRNEMKTTGRLKSTIQTELVEIKE